MKTTGHVVLITGGATGIGFALAEKFHAAGNRVILVGRTQTTLSQAAAALPGAITRVADIARASDRARLAAEFPEVTLLVNNAGIQVNAPLLALAAEQIEHEHHVNFMAQVLLCRAFLPQLVRCESAAIVNVTSGLALVPKQVAAMYCASKAALHSFSKTLRWQLEDSSVKVFEVLPPLVETAMTSGRGTGKITAAQLAEEFWIGFKHDRFEMLIGKTKLLAVINRLAPAIAEKMLRHGL